jgi:hypothetical protein
MRTLKGVKGINFISRNEITKNDYIETILLIIRKILDYTSNLNQITPSLFDEKNIESEKEDNTSASTSISSNEEKSNNSIIEKEEEKYSLTDYLYLWVEIFNFDENLLILTMMNIDKILAKEFILTSDNVKNILFTCMVITQKYYEDEYFNDKDYSKILKINTKKLIEMEVELLVLIDYSLYISEEEFNKYKNNMKNIWKKNLSLFNFT